MPRHYVIRRYHSSVSRSRHTCSYTSFDHLWWSPLLNAYVHSLYSVKVARFANCGPHDLPYFLRHADGRTDNQKPEETMMTATVQPTQAQSSNIPANTSSAYRHRRIHILFHSPCTAASFCNHILSSTASNMVIARRHGKSPNIARR